MTTRFAFVIVVAACGGSHHRSETPAAKQEDPGDKLRKEEPPSPYETKRKVAYRVAERCGQGPYRIEADALGARYGEKLEVYACGPRTITGNARLTTLRDKRSEEHERSFGYKTTDNAGCTASRATTTAGGSDGGAGSGSGARPADKHAATAAPKSAKPIELERVDTIPECRLTTSMTSQWSESDGFAPLASAHFAIEFWSNEPNDLDGVVFVIEQQAVVDGMTPERWHAYQAAYSAWIDRYRAYVDGELASGRSHVVDTSVKTPPPPPPRAETRPPSPSEHARWIAGYWIYEDGAFHWIAGTWSVPDEDVAKQLTARAPAPPPAPKTEQPVERAPTRTAVWVPGYWAWNGRAYVWVAGAWRIPPAAGQTWQPARWVVAPGGVVFSPGGWRRR